MKNSLCLLIAVLTLAYIGCIPPKAIFLGKPDPKDGMKFHSVEINPGSKVFEFAKSASDWGDKIKVTDRTSDLPVFNSIRTLLQDHKTRAFLIIRRDTILYEQYFRDYHEETLHPSWSMAKSFLATLSLFALEDAYIDAIDSHVMKFIPELASDPKAADLRISDLLNHTSGIAYQLSLDGTIYYGNDILKSLDKLNFDEAPGKTQRYLNINHQLMGILLRRATGMSLAQYLQKKIWEPLGMESRALWNSDKNDVERSFCCLNVSARDYARFGRLFLKKGNWNGKQLISESMVKRALSTDTSRGSSFNYNYSWVLGLDSYGDFMANGLYKQNIYMYPGKEIIIVSLHDKEDKLKSEMVVWPWVFRQELSTSFSY